MDSFSISSANEIFAAFPEWQAVAREGQADDGSSFLVIEINPPVEADVECGLVIDTSNQEITVGFDCYHSHFDKWVGDGNHFGTQAALHFVEQIVSEQVAVISWWQGEQWRGSSQLEAGAPPEQPQWQTHFDRIRIRSWKGSFNADINA